MQETGCGYLALPLKSSCSVPTAFVQFAMAAGWTPRVNMSGLFLFLLQTKKSSSPPPPSAPSSLHLLLHFLLLLQWAIFSRDFYFCIVIRFIYMFTGLFPFPSLKQIFFFSFCFFSPSSSSSLGNFLKVFLLLRSHQIHLYNHRLCSQSQQFRIIKLLKI